MFNLNKFIEDSKYYQADKTFQYSISENLWDKEFLNKVNDEINVFDDWDGTKNFYGSTGKRFCNSLEKLPFNVSKLINFCNSKIFLNTLEEITGEKGLIPDPYLEGGGVHSTLNKGFLKMHTDFNWHKKLKLYRRLNLLIYVNPIWEDKWLGHLKFGLKKGTNIEVNYRISPTFNKTVLFTTTDSSFHGHPDPLNAPKGISRNSIAIYYYISQKPKGSAIFKRLTTNYIGFKKDKFNLSKFKLKIKNLINKFYE